MQTLVKPVFTFARLLESDDIDAIEKARRFIIDNFPEWEFESEYMIDWLQEQLEDIGFIDASIQYSGFYSQGDGASFTAKIDLEKLFQSIDNPPDELNPRIRETLLSFPLSDDYRRLLDFNIGNYVDWSIVRGSSRYVHSNTCHVEFNEYSLQKDSDSPLYVVLLTLTEDLEQIRSELSEDIYRILEDAYNYTQEDETLIETANCHGIKFFESGKAYSE